MIKDSRGNTLTPTQTAKQLIAECGEGAFCWQERGNRHGARLMLNMSEITAREEQAICDAVERQFNRLHKLFGLTFSDRV